MNLEKELVATRDRVNTMEERWEKNREVILETFEVLASFLAWYDTNMLELSQNLKTATSVELNNLVTKAKMLAGRAVLL